MAGSVVRGHGGGARVIPARGLLLVTPVDAAERFAGGSIIVPVDVRERLTANQYEVLAVGAFAACDDEECERLHYHDEYIDNPLVFVRIHPHPVRVGDWILVAPRSAIDGPDSERAERFVHQDSVLGIFNAESNNADS